MTKESWKQFLLKHHDRIFSFVECSMMSWAMMHPNEDSDDPEWKEWCEKIKIDKQRRKNKLLEEMMKFVNEFWYEYHDAHCSACQTRKKDENGS
jgi:hypothetical protein